MHVSWIHDVVSVISDYYYSFFQGDHGTNLLYHLSSHHPEEHKIVTERNKLSRSEEPVPVNDENDSNILNNSNRSNNSRSENSTNSKLTYLQTQCVNLVTVHGRPFSLMNDLVFKHIIAMTTITPRECQSINSHSIRSLISEAADRVRMDIRDAMKGRLISLKIDSATRLDRTFFAVNAH